MLNLKNCYILLYFIYTIFGYNIWIQIIMRNKIEDDYVIPSTILSRWHLNNNGCVFMSVVNTSLL